MGRELKRVPLDFDWPMNIPWKGYMNPYDPTECKVCEGSGLNKETKKISADWYTHSRTDGKEGWNNHLEQEEVNALIEAGRLWDFTRVPRNEEQKKIVEEKISNGENCWLPDGNGYIPTAEEINEWNRKGFGHDSINKWICVQSRAKRLGVYGKCPLCKGKGHYFCEDEYESLYQEWEGIEPPDGEGYQIWETVSEGSPISPVFETPEELAQYMSTTRWGADSGTSYEVWLKFIKGPGWAMSAVSDGLGNFKTGVEAVVEMGE